VRTLDACAGDFVADCAARGEAGAFRAASDLARLIALAARLAADLMCWKEALDELDLAREGRIEPARAGRLIVESVFDEALTPAGSRLLSAALVLECHKR
jgi:hypothetical protein